MLRNIIRGWTWRWWLGWGELSPDLRPGLVNGVASRLDPSGRPFIAALKALRHPNRHVISDFHRLGMVIRHTVPKGETLTL